MYNLTEKQYQNEGKLLFDKVFVSNSAIDEPFSSHIIERLILYRYEPYLDDLLINGLIHAASNLGDTGCYIVHFSQNEKTPNYFYIPLPELLEAYEGTVTNDLLNGAEFDIDYWLDYALYSATGKWGLMISHEHHGLLGGSSNFIDEMRKYVPNLDRQVYDFINKYQQMKGLPNVTIEWIPKLLTHIYGKKNAEKMLKEAELI